MAVFMAKKREGDREAEEQPKTGAKKPKGFVLSMRGSGEWRVWLEHLVEHDRSTIPDVIDRALAKYAKSIGFREKQPKR